jgi:glycosyltransferase involved in cell wall biosynthesis
MPDGSPWPRISIVTPSFNQGQFLEETIRSVLLQGYPDIEYIIIDGGSTDNSVEIIKKYEPWLAYWVSEPDRGQSHAINKGFERSTGEIMAWLNSDDMFLPEIFGTVGENIAGFSFPMLLIGNRVYIDAKSLITKFCYIGFGQANLSLIAWGISPGIFQESSFWNRSAWSICGPLDERLFGAFDLDFFCRILSQKSLVKENCKFFGAYRKWGNTKCEIDSERVMIEVSEIRSRYRKGFNLLRYKISRILFRKLVKILDCLKYWSCRKYQKRIEIGGVLH